MIQSLIAAPPEGSLLEVSAFDFVLLSEKNKSANGFWP